MCIYLYVKTHNITGLKYLGKTIAKDPHKYKGSGKYWQSHIKQHGYDVTTTILQECQTEDEVKYWGLYYSNLWNILTTRDTNDKKVWANLKVESGDGGSEKGRKLWRGTMPEYVKLKISATMKGRPAHNKGKHQIHKTHKPRTSISGLTYNRKHNTGSNGKLLNIPRPRVCCLLCKNEVDVANLSRYHKHI